MEMFPLGLDVEASCGHDRGISAEDWEWKSDCTDH